MIFGIDIFVIGIVLLVGLSIGGIAYAFIIAMAATDVHRTVSRRKTQ